MPPGPPELSLGSTRDGDVCTVVLAGELDLYTSTRVNLEFEELFTTEPAPASVNVDLAGVTFIDSVGLAILIRAQRRAEDVGGRLVVGPMSAVVAQVMEMSGLTDRLARGTG